MESDPWVSEPTRGTQEDTDAQCTALLQAAWLDVRCCWYICLCGLGNHPEFRTRTALPYTSNKSQGQMPLAKSNASSIAAQLIAAVHEH